MQRSWHVRARGIVGGLSAVLLLLGGCSSRKDTDANPVECLPRDVKPVAPPIAKATVQALALEDGFQNEILATGFTLPTCIKFLPDGRLLVVELAGKIKVLPPPYTQASPDLFLQLTNVGSAGVQQGIYDLVFDPQFESNHYYYIFYTAGSPNHDRVSRFTATADLSGTVAGSELILYEDKQWSHAEHHGGALAFDNDGFLMFATGEHFDPPVAQYLSNPRGKLHRIRADGSVPTDNPFYDGDGPNVDSIWALGLRNPYRAYYDLPSKRWFIGDVGGNDNATSIEELNIGVRGANYGWPDCESGSCGNPGFTGPIYSYPHADRDACITAGFVYHGDQFPSRYKGSFFFADYTQNWIRNMTFDAEGRVAQVTNFEPQDGTSDGPTGDIVYLAEGPDGALYYLDLGYSDVGATFGTSKLRRIRYVQGAKEPVAAASAMPNAGQIPLSVKFSSAGSSDPQNLPLTFMWDFADGASSTEANPTHVYEKTGTYVVRLMVSNGRLSTLAAPITVTAGAPPVAEIVSPADGSTFVAGDRIEYRGRATDHAGTPLPESAYNWNIDFLHNGHVHPALAVSGVTSGTLAIATQGHDYSGDTRYRITLAVLADGLSSRSSVITRPEKVNLSIASEPPGLTVYLDGIAKQTPFAYDSVPKFVHQIDAHDGMLGSMKYEFDSWSDGGARAHSITVPDRDLTLTVKYKGKSTYAPGQMQPTAAGGSAPAKPKPDAGTPDAGKADAGSDAPEPSDDEPSEPEDEPSEPEDEPEGDGPSSDMPVCR